MSKKSFIVCGLFLLLSSRFLLAQPAAAVAVKDSLDRASDLSVMLEALATVEPVTFDSLPKNRRGQVASVGFVSMQHPEWPLLPGNIFKLDVWPLGEGHFVLDDRKVDYAALEAAARLEEAASINYAPQMRMMSSSLASYAYGNPVYLTNLVVTSVGGLSAAFDISGGTNNVPYDIQMTTNLLTPWNWLGIGYTSNRYTFASQPTDAAFYRLAKPTKTMTVGFGDDAVAQCSVPFGLSNLLQVVGGGAHTLALKNDGNVLAWGWNGYGQTTVPANLSNVVMVAAGYYHSVALLTNGAVVAWGFNTFFYPLTQVPASLTNATVISALATHTLALRQNGTVVAWGYDQGSGATVVPAGLSNVVAIAAGANHSLAVSNGMVVAWGANNNGQCHVPAGLSNVVDVAAGAYHSLALKSDGTVVAWGGSAAGETNVPAGLSNVVAIAAGGDTTIQTGYSLALKKDGSVVSWGNDAAADPVGGLNHVIAIAAGADHALAIRTGPATPVITLEPFDQYQVAGSNVTFTARGAGLYGVNYQWQTNSVNLPGATNAALTLTNVQPPAQLASYRVNVANEVGSLMSSNAGFYFVTPPVILSQTLPTNQVAIYLHNVALSVAATAPGIYNGFPLSYQWLFNGSNIAGATASNYTFQAKVTSPGNYSVRVSNAAGSTNAFWQLTVLATNGIQFVQQPTNQYQIAGGNVAFVATAISSNPVTYQWQFNGTNLNGAINPTLLLTNVQATQAGQYRSLASDGANTLASSNGSFTLVTVPTITAQNPGTNLLAVFQTNLVLSVSVFTPGQTNGFPLRYQWQWNGTNINGATATNYSFIVNETNGGNYSVVITNTAGSVTSLVWSVVMTFAGSYIDVGTLAYHLSTNAAAHTNWYGIPTVQLANWEYKGYSGTNMPYLTNAVWATNFWLHGVEGLSATSIGASNGLGGQGLITMVSPRHFLFATHIFIQSMQAFLDTNNILYWRTVLQQTNLGNDISVGILDNDLPSAVGFLPVLSPSFTNYFTTNSFSFFEGIGMNQDMRVFSQPMVFDGPILTHWSPAVSCPFGPSLNWNLQIRTGDSSDPVRLLIENRLVLVSHNFHVFDGPNYSLQKNNINLAMHFLSTNNSASSDYQVTLFELTNWPSIHP